MTAVSSRVASWALWALLLVLASAGLARAQVGAKPSPRMRVDFRDGVPHLSVQATALDTPAFRDKLASGLPQTIVMRHYAYRSSGGKPLGVTVSSCRVVFDIWQERYRVQLQRGLQEEVRTFADVAQVVRACLDVRDLAVGKAVHYGRAKQIYLATLVELNPLSDQTIARIRRWLARPGGGDIERQAFFGSFVSLFVNHRIGDAERSLGLRSSTVQVP